MNTSPTVQPIELFYSHAAEDEELRQTLDKHLTMLKRQGLITSWYCRLITAGTSIADESIRHLNTASIILLLVSPDYIASDYCYGTEIQRAMQRHEAGEARVIPILLRPCYYPGAPFAKLQALPSHDKPITSWADRDQAFASVAREIHKAIEELTPAPRHEQSSTPQRPWNVPYTRNPFFTGHEQLLTQLRSNLSASQTAALTQPQAISGLGGIGKTQTAVEYAYRYRDSYQAVLWATAATREGLGLEFVKLATLLSLPQYDTQDATVNAVKSWLTRHADWLLILDNADDLAMASTFFPDRSRTNGHILLTTRADVAGTLAQPLSVEKMDKEEGTLLLLRRARLLSSDAELDKASSQDRAQAEAILREMDGLPLALDQAGAYIEETNCSLADYLTLYRTHRQKLLHHQGKYGSDHAEPVATTWNLSFQEVTKANPASADLLRLCAFLAPDAIPEELLKDGSSTLPSTLQPLASDLFKLNAAIEVLRRYSLLKRNPTTKTLAIHRLVQVVLRDSMNKQTQKRWAERVVRVLYEAFPDVTDIATWPQCQRYMPHVQACAVLIDEYSLSFTEAGVLLHGAAYYLQDQAQYTEAASLYQQALAIGEKVDGPLDPSTAATLHALGALAQAQGKYTQAQSYYQRALAINEQSLPTYHPDTAATLHELGVLAQAQGEYTQAQSYYQRALSIYEQSLPPTHPFTASTLHELGRLAQAQGQYAQAQSYYQRVLAIEEQSLPANHPYTAITLHQLGTLAQAQGEYTQAQSYYQRALSIYEQSLPSNHPFTASTLHELGRLAQAQGQYAQAQSYYQRVLAIEEQSLPANHPYTAITLHALAILYENQGKYEEAEPLYQRSLAIYEKLLPNHPDTAIMLENYARFLRKMKREKEAIELEKRARAIREKRGEGG